MNDKKHDKQNDMQRYPGNEEQVAEQTVRVLEARTGEARSKDDQATVELGRLLRDAAQVDLPESNVDLREQLMAELDGASPAAEQEMTVSSEVVSGKQAVRSAGRRRFWVATAASGLLLVGGTIAYNSGFVGQLSNVALLENTGEPDVEPTASPAMSGFDQSSPEVVFRTETRTWMAPVTRMTTETKTRSVPISRVREETRQVKQADGSLRNVRVKVPYTENVPQSYTVQVPVAESVAQSYTVQVPYTADGKRIEKSDYGKYGLDGSGGVGGTDAPTGTMVFPDADTWREKSLRRSNFKEFRLAGEPGSSDDGELSEPPEPAVAIPGLFNTAGEAIPKKPGSGEGHDNGIIGQFSLGGDGGREQAKRFELTQELARSQAALKGGRDAMMEHIWILETEGKIANESMKAVDESDQIAGGRRIDSDDKIAANKQRLGKGLNRPAEFIAGGELPFAPVKKKPLSQGGDLDLDLEHDELSDLEELESSAIEGEAVSELASKSDVGLDNGIIGQFQNQGRESRFRIRKADLRKAREQLVRDMDIADRQILEQSSTMQTRIVSEGSNSRDAKDLLAKMSDKFHKQIKQIDRKLAALKDAEANSGEQYEPIFENAFIAAKGPAAISTFSIDVDTASYANMRRLLNSGQRPPADSIRLEELVNYFKYDYEQPTGEHPFSVNLDLADCPWQDGHQLLRVGLKGKDIHVAERPATNVVFLIDVSGSMSSNDKLPLLKSGFQMMSQQLGENDRVSIVTYAGNAGVVLPPTNGTQTETINNAIERLSSGGSTHGSAGIKLAYELAQQNFIEGGVNRVMLATDGDLNVGVTSDDALVSLIKEKAAEGVFLTVLGFGSGNLKDAKLEKLADNGNGMYAYIDSTREARRVLVEQLSGSLVTIAKDVKIQVEFNPAEVKSYRLLGYENRMLETKDFDDDRKDAGEIGAGHTVTAIYQIEPAKAVARPVDLPAGMKYQVQADADVSVDDQEGPGKDGLSKAAMSGDLATVALRYKQPEASESRRLEVSVKNQPKRFEEASDDFRFAASVAGFGMYLRGSKHRGAINAGQLQRIASGAIGDDEAGYRAEFIDLIRKASGR